MNIARDEVTTMNQDHSNEIYVMLRHQELLRAAERERLAATARSGRRGGTVLAIAARVYRPALAWFGLRLMEAGRRLQAQGNLADDPVTG
jgi:hypothetical protein